MCADTFTLCFADKQHQCDEEDRRYRQLKAAQAETEMSSKVQAIRVSDSVVHSQINIAKDRLVECVGELLSAVMPLHCLCAV